MPRTSAKGKVRQAGNNYVILKDVKSKKVKAELVTSEVSQTPKRRISRKVLFLVLLLVGLGLLIYNNKGWFVAGMVNGQPVTTIEVIQRMNTQFKERTLNQMINEKILEQEAAKKGITVTGQQVLEKITEVEKQYGGTESFNMLLSQQGLTRDDFNRQTKIQLIVEKLYENDIKPTPEEIKKFMEENTEATDSAKVTEQLKQEKLSNVFAEKFQQLKQSAKVQTF